VVSFIVDKIPGSLEYTTRLIDKNPRIPIKCHAKEKLQNKQK